MTLDQFIGHVDGALRQASTIDPSAPHPQGSFVATPPRGPATGLRVVAPDGTAFYLAVYEAAAFDRPEADSSED